MLPRHLIFVLIAAVECVSVGCRGEAAPSAHRLQSQISSSAAAPINETPPTPRNAAHMRAFRKDTPHESFLSTYNNPEQGISFRYPRNYSLEEGDVEERSFFLQRQEDLDAEQPGAKLLATVLIPEDAYPNTTFEHGSLQLVINAAETENACIAMSEAETMGKSSTAVPGPGMLLHWSGQETEIADTKIFRRTYAGYSQGSCYQFQLMVAAGESPDPNGFTKNADLVRIMKQLENIVASSRVFTRSVPAPVEISKQTDRL
jgi:hypothetical protein